VRGRLCGSSALWIFTRGTGDKIETKKPIMFLKKQKEVRRLYCNFGQMNVECPVKDKVKSETLIE